MLQTRCTLKLSVLYHHKNNRPWATVNGNWKQTLLEVCGHQTKTRHSLNGRRSEVNSGKWSRDLLFFKDSDWNGPIIPTATKSENNRGQYVAYVHNTAHPQSCTLITHHNCQLHKCKSWLKIEWHQLYKRKWWKNLQRFRKTCLVYWGSIHGFKHPKQQCKSG